MKKRFFVRLICFFLALLAVPAGYFAAVQSLPAMFQGSLMGSVYVKQQLVQNTPGKRVLVVGGSSVPYSSVNRWPKKPGCPASRWGQRPIWGWNTTLP